MPFTNIRKDIGARLRAARKAAKVTLQQAGAEVGRSKQAVLAWEAGTSDVSATQLAVLAALYGATADQLIFGVKSVELTASLGRMGLTARSSVTLSSPPV